MNDDNHPIDHNPVDQDPIDADLRAAFDRLRHDTAQVDTMSALRNREDGRGRNRWKVAALAIGGGLGGVLLVLGGLALRNDDVEVDVGPAEPGDPTALVLNDDEVDVGPAEPGDPTALILPTFPDGKVISSLSSVSDSEWFALSDLGPVGRASPSLLWHTNDAGVTWVDTQSSGSGWVHFADPLNGWLVENQCCLFGTHDGGVTWKQIHGVLPRGDLESAPAIASADGRVYVLADVVVRGNSRVGVMSSPVERDEFVWSGTAMGDATFALTPSSGQLVIRGESGWAIAYGAMQTTASKLDESNVPGPGAVRRIDGEWTAWDPPCAASMEGVEQYTTVQLPRLLLGASPSGQTVAVVCREPSGGPLRTFVSVDGGATFVEAEPLDGVTMTERSWILVPDDDTILLGVALDTGELVVQGSNDGGRSWTVETSFADGKEFAPVTVTPTGLIVVVAGAEARFRDDQGTWLPIGG